MFFQLLSTIKVNLMAKIMQSAYLCVIFHVKHKKIPFLMVMMAAMIATIVGNTTGLQQRHHS